ncbi:NtaA/DmoA family FMN-dependent monooxygenase [Streptomyces sp. NPDC001604]|uniref:NtaA/DmoA family FMN-dependent monooxygenase n=1 Tax=Streptomyces sp. NPDC001604 TaxID=3364593 RepID=UPI00369A21DC
MRTDRTPMRLGALLPAPALGHHAAAWRHPDVRPERAFSFDHYRTLAQTAERGGLDFLLLGDSPAAGAGEAAARGRDSAVAHLEPLTLLSALAVHTRHIGLAATASTTCTEPFALARTLASLDFLSGGRCGWHVTVPVSDTQARNVGLERAPGEQMAYHRAQEFLEVTGRLWDCWEDDAFLYDQAGGRYLDPAKVHVPDHRGDHFRVRGPLTVPRPPQGRPVLLHPAAGVEARELAAQWADVVLMGQQSVGRARAERRAWRALVAGRGRDPQQVPVLATVFVVTGRTRAEAEDTYATLQDLLEPAARPASGSAPGGPAFLLGSARQVADELEEWFTQGAADGFVFLPGHLPAGLAALADLVVPELRRRHLARARYDGYTLRDHLGLARPATAVNGSGPLLKRLSKHL